jgi:uncharacterized membrane protein
MDQFVQFLFKYKWSLFAKGDLRLANRPSWLILALILIAFGALIYFLYIRPPYRISTSNRVGLAVLRTMLLLLLAFLLMRPVLVISSVIPQSTSIAVLADNSRSMQLTDENGRPRLDAIKELMVTGNTFIRGLESKFKVKTYSFADTTARIPDPQKLDGQGIATDLPGSLDMAVKDASGLPLSAIVVLTDGGSNTPRDLTAQLRDLRARNLPVFTVGVGSTQRFKDAEISRVTAPRRVLNGSAVSAEALIQASGYPSTRAIVAVSEDGKAIKSEPVELRGDEAQTVTVEFTPATVGTHRYTFELKPLEGELTVENNAQESIIEVTDEHPKVLYIEGEPRWEYGKMRWSLTRNEKNLTLVSVLRSADGKFYRQGVESGQELESGFPRTIEELFAYQGIMLGSIEANFFSYDQLKMIEEFASKRGGGFLALGGSHAFDAGKFANTPIAAMLPLDLNDRIDEPEMPPVVNFKAEMTTRGRTHAVTRLNEDRSLSAKAWEELPPITVLEVLPQIKPGATVILEGRSLTDKKRTVPLLAEERYGRGRTMVLTASDTWRWRMQMDAKNGSHETFWRQLLRYVVSTTPHPIEVQTERDVYAAGDAVTLRGDVNDKKYEPIKEAQTLARITTPSGEKVEVPLTFGLNQGSTDYRATYQPTADGLYKVELEARLKGEVVGRAQTSFFRTDRSREYFDARQNVELLRRVSSETGGKYYAYPQANELVEDISYLEGNNSERVSKDLWDMPFNFMLLVGLVAGEWFLRKRSGLA